MTKITKIYKNCMGTLSLECKFNGMRKAQEFIVYPMHQTQDHILIQSGTRIGRVFLATGQVVMSKPVSSGAYAPHLALASEIDTLDTEELAGLKFRLVQTAGNLVGNSVIKTDNSGAELVSIFNA